MCSRLNEQKQVPHEDFPILASTTVGALLDQYPQLEDVLVEIAPPFKKLKNPILRKGVARVASLKHAAAIGGIAVTDLVNKLCAAVGQETIAEDASSTSSYFSGQPEWFCDSKIVRSIDERSAEQSKMPIAVVLQETARLKPGDILELVTAFLPAPGIDIMKKKGLRVWSVRQNSELVRTYVSKPA